MSETWRKSHNISILIYHFVCPAKYRKVVINDEVDEVLRKACLEIEKRYEIKFISLEQLLPFLMKPIEKYLFM